MLFKNSVLKVLVTCPAMVANRKLFIDRAKERNLELDFRAGQQTLSSEELTAIIGTYDGWIIGDDPCPRSLLETAKKGKLRSIVKWGVGLDNIDLKSASEIGIRVSNTPGTLGNEVADLALTYINALAREIISIHESVKSGEWSKPTGVSLAGRLVGIVGFGDIGQCLNLRLAAAEMKSIIFEVDNFPRDKFPQLRFEVWPNSLEELDFLVFCCPLNEGTRQMLNFESLERILRPMFVVNMSRGEVVAEEVLIAGLKRGKFRGIALDVYEHEPLALTSELREYPNVIFGTHNASNTEEAVARVSNLALEKIYKLLTRNS